MLINSFNRFNIDFKYAKDHIPKAEEKGVKDIMKMGGHESSKEIFETIEERISESLKSNPSELPQASAVSAVTAMTGEVKVSALVLLFFNTHSNIFLVHRCSTTTRWGF